MSNVKINIALQIKKSSFFYASFHFEMLFVGGIIRITL